MAVLAPELARQSNRPSGTLADRRGSAFLHRLLVAAMLVDVAACWSTGPDRDECADPYDSDAIAEYYRTHCFVEHLSVLPANPTLVIGRAVRFTADVELTEGCGVRPGTVALISWSTSDATIATLTNQGAQQVDVVGVRPGRVSIIAQGNRDPNECEYSGSSRNYTEVTVQTMRVERVTVSSPSPTLVVGETLPLRATVLDDLGFDVTSGVTVTWTSSSNSIATVNNQGAVTAVAKGPVVITASVVGVSGFVNLVVGDPPPEPVSSVTIDGPTVVQGGKTIELTVSARSSNGTLLADRPVLWSSDAPTKAGVSPKPNVIRVGIVAGEKVGKAVIKAQVERKEAEVEITVIPGDVAKVTVTPGTAAIRITNSIELSAEAQDIKENVVLNRTFTWTSLTPTVATVSGTGVVTGVAQGSSEVRATTAGVNGSAMISVTPRRIAYGVANQPFASVSYNAAFAYNPAGGNITILRQSAGVYRVTFPGLRAQSGETETILVSRYGEGSQYCKLADDWANGAGNDLVAEVRCFSWDGAPASVEFSITLLGDGVLFGRFGFGLANQPSAAGPYTPAKSYNSGVLNPPPMTVQRAGVGRYVVRFPGNVPGQFEPKAIHVSAVGTTAVRCNVPAVAQDAIYVSCYSAPNVQFVDSPFTIMLTDRGRGGANRAGYVWAVDQNGDEFEAPGFYPIPPTRSYNSSLGAVDVTRESYDVGRYDVVFRGLMLPGSAPTLGVQVMNRDADEPMYCNVVNWAVIGTDLRVTVQCWHSYDGEPEDEGFFLLVIQ